MTYEMYRDIYIGGACFAAFFLVISVLLFVVLKIPSVFGDLTGRRDHKTSIRCMNWDKNHVRRSVIEVTGTQRLAQEQDTVVLAEEMLEQSVFRIEMDITFVHTDEMILQE